MKFSFAQQFVNRAWMVALAMVTLSSSAGVFHYAEDGVTRRRWNIFDFHQQVPETVVDRTNRTVIYYVADDLFSGPGTQTELNAIKAVFDQWSAIPGSSLRYEYAGLEPAANADVNLNQKNVVFWVKDSTLVNNGQVNISGALGFAFSSFFLSTQTLAEVDIVLNGNLYDWSSDVNETSTIPHLIEGVLSHEVGHMSGLQHSPGGGTTMYVRGRSGSRTIQLGLSVDEQVATRALYSDGSHDGATGRITGVARMGGAPVLGAGIYLEDLDGNLISSTFSRADGSYEIPMVPAGSYTIFASPLDFFLTDPNYVLLQPREISQEFNDAESFFLPTARAALQVNAGQNTAFDFSLVDREPGFRISRIRDVSDSRFLFTRINAPTRIAVGAQNLYLGVFGRGLPVTNPIFEISGNDITIEEIESQLNQGGTEYNMISARVSVSPNAKPGLRTFLVRTETDMAYAPGYLEVTESEKDYNFDGLSDEFQRRYFPLFTAPEAAPSADPDQDGFSNEIEKIAQSVPTDFNSVPSIRLNSMTLGLNGARITWSSFVGQRYQVWRRTEVGSGAWEKIGSPVTASGAEAEFLDAEASEMRYYRVELVR